MVCEQAFAELKRYGIAHQVYRNRKAGFDDRSMVTAAGRWKLLSGGDIAGNRKRSRPVQLVNEDLAISQILQYTDPASSVTELNSRNIEFAGSVSYARGLPSKGELVTISGSRQGFDASKDKQ